MMPSSATKSPSSSHHHHHHQQIPPVPQDNNAHDNNCNKRPTAIKRLPATVAAEGKRPVGNSSHCETASTPESSVRPCEQFIASLHSKSVCRKCGVNIHKHHASAASPIAPIPFTPRIVPSPLLPAPKVPPPSIGANNGGGSKAPAPPMLAQTLPFNNSGWVGKHPGCGHANAGTLLSPVDEFDVAAFLDDEFAMGILGTRIKGRVIKPKAAKTGKASPIDGSILGNANTPTTHPPLFIPTHVQNNCFMPYPNLQIPSMLSMGISFPGMLNGLPSPISADPTLLHHHVAHHHQHSNEQFETIHPDYADVGGMSFEPSEKNEDGDPSNPLKKTLGSIQRHCGTESVPLPDFPPESESTFGPYQLPGMEGHGTEGMPHPDVFSQHMDSSFHPVISTSSLNTKSKSAGKQSKQGKEHVSRRRSAPREHLHLVGQYCESGPWSRIRVWKNDRNQIFYDCLCGKRVPIQHLKKIKHHAESHDVNQYVCDTCGREFDHYLKRNAHQKTHKKGGSEDVAIAGSESSSMSPTTPITAGIPPPMTLHPQQVPVDAQALHGVAPPSNNPSDSLPHFSLSGVHQPPWL